MRPVAIPGKLIALRELDDGDAEALHAVYGNAKVTDSLSFDPRTPEQCAAIIAAAQADAEADPRQVYMLAVADPAGLLVGAARLGLGEWRSAQFGIAIRPDRWGRGEGTEVVRLLQRLAFRDLGVHRFWGARSPSNAASGRLMAAAGMTEDGRIRSHVLRHGQWEDSCTASILEEEFDG
jgi:ribosomal-protein-alanine N-acetyltransferase